MLKVRSDIGINKGNLGRFPLGCECVSNFVTVSAIKNPEKTHFLFRNSSSEQNQLIHQRYNCVLIEFGMH
jgi:hypothetical protein